MRRVATMVFSIGGTIAVAIAVAVAITMTITTTIAIDMTIRMASTEIGTMLTGRGRRWSGCL